MLITHAESPCGYVTVSIGVESLVPEPGRPASDLVEAADRALYAAARRVLSEEKSRIAQVVTPHPGSAGAAAHHPS